MYQIEELLSRLNKVKSTGTDKYLACCPAHDDRSPSLAISVANNRLLIHCFAGCEATEILEAVNMDMSALFDDPQEHTPPTTAAQEKRIAKEQGHTIFRAKHYLLVITSALRRKEHVTEKELAKAHKAKSYLQSVGMIPVNNN